MPCRIMTKNSLTRYPCVNSSFAIFNNLCHCNQVEKGSTWTGWQIYVKLQLSPCKEWLWFSLFKAVFHLANFIAQIDISCCKLTRFLICYSRQPMRQKGKSLHAIKFAWWKAALKGFANERLSFHSSIINHNMTSSYLYYRVYKHIKRSNNSNGNLTVSSGIPNTRKKWKQRGIVPMF